MVHFTTPTVVCGKYALRLHGIETITNWVDVISDSVDPNYFGKNGQRGMSLAMPQKLLVFFRQMFLTCMYRLATAHNILQHRFGIAVQAL